MSAKKEKTTPTFPERLGKTATLPIGVGKAKPKALPEINEYLAQRADEQAEEGEEGGGGKIETILMLYVKGYAPKDIIKAGFNKSTVYRQTRQYDQLRKGPITEYYGQIGYEARILRVMKNKKMTREEAVEYITGKDLEE